MTDPEDFKNYLKSLTDKAKFSLLLMSSGNYGGLNFDDVKSLIAE